jgi:hypothetical protein
MEPFRIDRIQFRGAGIHSPFTSLLYLCDLRRGEAADEVNRPAMA